MLTPFIFLFHTPLGAVLLRKTLSAQGIDFKVIDAPRQLTADCGIAVSVILPDACDFMALLNHEVSAVYQYEAQIPRLRWQDET